MKPGWEIAFGAAAGLALVASMRGAPAERAVSGQAPRGSQPETHAKSGKPLTRPTDVTSGRPRRTERHDIPLVPGNRWVYALRKTGSLTMELPDGPRTVPTGTRGTSLERVMGEDRETFSVPTTVLQATISERPMRGEPRSLISQSYWRRTEQGLVGYGRQTGGLQGVLSESLERYPKPALLFKLPFAAGMKWSVGKISGAGLTMALAAEVSGPATVRVPAGTFRGCWKVTYRYHGVRGKMTFPKVRLDVEDGSGANTVWIAPGVGSVKEVEAMRMRVLLYPGKGGPPVPGEGATNSVKQLTSYRVARRR